MLKSGMEDAQSKRSIAITLALLCALTDLALIIAHLANATILEEKNILLNIAKSGGYGESFQYLKYYWIICIIIIQSCYAKNIYLLPWAVAMGFLMIDDMLELHEKLGTEILINFKILDEFEFYRKSLGELTVAIFAALTLALPIILIYKNLNTAIKLVYRNIAIILAALLFFGIGIDYLSSTIIAPRHVKAAISIIEEGGEMFSLSALTAYFFYLLIISKKLT